MKERTTITKLISASMLYDFLQCAHRPHMDQFADPKDRDEPNAFVKLLWENGNAFEKQVISELETPFLDLSDKFGDEKEHLTLEAMKRGENLIYSARITDGDLVGEPDILRRDDRGYIAIDIKAGSGEETYGDDKKPKKHYAVQLALYTDILERLNYSAARVAYVWDIHGEEVQYDFEAEIGVRNPRTLWQDYEEVLNKVSVIINGENITLPAFSGSCKMCHWYTKCTSDLESNDDLTLIFYLGGKRRDAMISSIPTISDLAGCNIQDFVEGKKTIFPGVGIKMLEKFQVRARLIKDAGDPILTNPITLPSFEKELFFDIESDPMRDCHYLHGFVERQSRDDGSEKYVSFFAKDVSMEAEEKAFAEAWQYIQASQPCAIYHYASHEKTTYKKLQQKYPDVCTEGQIEELFKSENFVDLYTDIVLKATEWPVRSYGIKYLATYLGFDWRDKHPSGAASIEWFHRWTETGDKKIRQRILDYNEDDCRATRVLVDGLQDMMDRQK